MKVHLVVNIAHLVEGFEVAYSLCLEVVFGLRQKWPSRGKRDISFFLPLPPIPSTLTFILTSNHHKHIHIVPGSCQF